MLRILQKRSFLFIKQNNYNFTVHINKVKSSGYKQKDNFRKISRMRHIDFTDANLKFPINVSLKYRTIYKPVKKLYVPQDNTRIDFERLNGNQILLAFQNLKLLSSEEILLGLQRLAKQAGQQNHNWRQHPWIGAALQHIVTNHRLYKKEWTMRLYWLMKSLRNDDPQMWKLIYSRLQQYIFKANHKQFIYFWEKYHNNTTDVSEQFRKDLFGLMQNKIRYFSGSSVTKAFKILYDYNLIDNYKLETVFISMFKSPAYSFTALEMSDILKIMMHLNHEENPRFYDAFYAKILKLKFNSIEELKILQDTLVQIQDIFRNHNLEPYLNYLKEQEKLLKNKVQLPPNKKLYELVLRDLRYYKEKLKIKKQEEQNKI